MNLPILRTKADLEDWRNESTDKPIYFVPTMGGLHAGHKRIIRVARDLSKQKDARVLISIFVNPLQFGENEDFQKYPRDIESDCKEAYEAGANIVWAPDFEDVFPGGEDFHFKINAPLTLQKHLCGAFRTNHFDGVATVVVRLLKLVQPTRLFLGEKDWQQLIILRQLVNELCIPVKIHSIPTIRDKDGLPYSSRNKYLSKEERFKALALPKVMTKAVQNYLKDDEINIDTLRRSLESKGLDVEYIEIVDPQTLNPINLHESRICLFAAAINCGQTRLIDHTFLMKRNPLVAIDGPAGAGKSTVTKLFAQRLGLIYLDTGAMYRAVTWFLQEKNINQNNQEELLIALKDIKLDIQLSDSGVQSVLLNEKEITREIRSHKVTSEVSLFASIKAIRENLTAQQQQLGKKGGLVAEGRDIGTTVFPDAELKVFLTASPRVRAERRAADLKKQGFTVPSLLELEKEIKERDRIDSTREISPLLKASDAKELMTDGMNIEDVIECLVDMFREKVPEEIWSTNTKE